MTHFKLPTWATLALSILAGVLSYLNLTTFGFPHVWQELVTVGLAALAALGIAPLTGPALQNVLHISHAAALSLASLVATASVAITTTSLNATAKNIIVAVLAVIAGALFGPAGGTPQPAPPAPAPEPAPAPPAA